MKKLTRTETAAWLKEHDNFAILTHTRPDGDTVGSAAGLCLGLRSLGKTAHVLRNPEVTPRYADIHRGFVKDHAEEGDTLVSVDVAADTMLPEGFREYLGRIGLRIDHHGTARSFTEAELVDPTMASCAEIVWDVLTEMGVVLDQETARGLYTGISTDTGCFRYVHNSHCFLAAAACTATGLDVFGINQRLHDTNTLSRLRLQGWIVEHTRLMAGGRLALCVLPRSVEQELGVTEDDRENIGAFPRTIEGVCLAATLRETDEGEAKLSVRSIPGYDSAAVCARFGGGGHAGAAGANTHLPLQEAAQAVEKILTEMA